MYLKNKLIELLHYIRPLTSTQHSLQYISLFVIGILLYHTSNYFVIIITIFDNNIQLKWFLVVSIILLLFRKNQFVIFFFWLILLIMLSFLYLIYIELFFDLEVIRDYIIEYNKHSAIKICYTPQYKYYFIIEYLKLIYSLKAKDHFIMDNILFNPEYFEQCVKYCNFDNVLFNNKITVHSIKMQCHLFINNYINYRLEQTSFFAYMEKELLWQESFIYNLLLFIRNSTVILIMPFILKTLHFKILNKFFNDYFIRKAINAFEYHFYTHPLIHFVFEGTALERQDFFLTGALFLIKKYGKRWIYDQPWYRNIKQNI